MYAVPSRTRAHMGITLRRQAGATLIEQVLVAILIAGLIVAGLIAWTMAQTSAKDNSNLADMSLLISKIRSAYAGQSTYGTGSLNATLLTYRAVPPSMISGTSIVNTWGGTVTVTGAGATVTVSSAAIPQENCASMVKSFGGSTGGGSGITGISVNGSALTLPVTTATAATGCNAANNTVVLTIS